MCGYTDCGGRGSPAATAALTTRLRAQSRPAFERARLRTEVALAERDPLHAGVRRDRERRLEPERGLEQRVHPHTGRDVVRALELRHEDAVDRELRHGLQVGALSRCRR